MANKIIFSIDVEPDLHTGKHNGIRVGLKKFESICDKYKVRPVLYVVASIMSKNKETFKRLAKKGWEISLHGYSHKRFDEMLYKEKEYEIKRSLEVFKKDLKIKPKGFRAPQHSIDSDTLDLLEKYGFKYDSSYTPLNLLQLFFFPRKFSLWLKSFFSPINPYKIRKNLIEIPPSSLLIPFVSLMLRVLPKWALYLYVKKIKLFYKKI